MASGVSTNFVAQRTTEKAPHESVTPPDTSDSAEYFQLTFIEVADKGLINIACHEEGPFHFTKHHCQKFKATDFKLDLISWWRS